MAKPVARGARDYRGDDEDEDVNNGCSSVRLTVEAACSLSNAARAADTEPLHVTSRSLPCCETSRSASSSSIASSRKSSSSSSLLELEHDGLICVPQHVTGAKCAEVS